MQNHNSFRISTFEFSLTFVSLNLGSIILFLPRGLAKELETPDGWISLLINGVIMLLLITLYTRLQQNFPEKNLLEFMRTGWMGKWITPVFSIIFIVHNLIIIALVTRILVITTNNFLLENTPAEVIAAVFLLTVAYSVSKGVQGVFHINLMLFPIVLFVLVVLFLMTSADFDFHELTPILSEGFSPILKGALNTSHPFVGGIYFFFMLMTYLRKEDLRPLPINLVSLIIPLTYITIIVLCYGVLGFEINKFTTFPLMEVVKSIEILEGVLGRFDPVFLTVWIIALFTTTSLSTLITVLIINNEFFKSSKKKQTWLMPILIFIVFNITFNPNNLSEVEQYSRDLLVSLGFILTSIAIGYGYLTVCFKNKKSTTDS
ncbi:GerAB/ArcD/ProY family transporter [Anaerobacillus sp. MEB173]|uniref:GerAB/ArcD/ProY family transporter n=1 Tax=Anaerobacillus sp. MEB173 TaxID=3383345 RepID=UPI003F921A02